MKPRRVMVMFEADTDAPMSVITRNVLNASVIFDRGSPIYSFKAHQVQVNVVRDRKPAGGKKRGRK